MVADYVQLYLEVFYFAIVLTVTRPLLVEVVSIRKGKEDANVPSKVRYFAQTW